MSSIEPRTLDELERAARVIMRCMSGDSVTLEATQIAMQQCAARGWSVWDAPGMTYVLQGRVGWSATGVRRSVLAVATAQVTERTAERFAMTVTPREAGSQPIEIVTTLDWAKSVKLYRVGKDASKPTKWQSDPATMLEAHGWRFASRRLCVDIGGSADDADPTPAEVAAATTEAAEAPAAPPATGRFQPRFSAPAPEIDYREALKPHTQLLRLADLPAEERKTLGAALLAAATPALVAELDDPATSDDTRRALLCSAMGATPEQEAIMLPRVKPDSSLLDAIRLAVDAAAVISDAPALDAYLASLDATGAAALWAAIEADAHTAAGRIPGVTTAPKRSKTGE